jgi:predicted KAP-like P-loop ATPase
LLLPIKYYTESMLQLAFDIAVYRDIDNTCWGILKHIIARAPDNEHTRVIKDTVNRGD